MKGRFVSLIVILLSVYGIAAVDGSAATLVVTKTADTADGVCDADCSLREAVIAASFGDIISFSSLFNSPQTITLTAGEILIVKNLTITGPGASLLSISGNDANRIFKVTNGAIVVISGFRLRNGRVAILGNSDGGAIYLTASSLELSNMIFNDNWARREIEPNNFAGRGGAIYGDQSTIVVRDTEFYNNTSANGAATYTDRGSITMLRVTVRNNTGPGVDAGSFERMDITDSRFIGNSRTGIVSTGITKISNSLIADNLYGGIAGFVGSTPNTSLEIEHCVVRNNRRATRLTDSGGGIISYRHATIRSTIVSGNRAVSAAGGIENGGTMYIYDSAIVANHIGTDGGQGGGGISTSGSPFYLINSTVSGNDAFGSGGGIYAWSNSELNIINSTIADNEASNGAGGGIFRDGNSVVHTRNSVFANNTAPAAGPDIYGTVVSQGFNIIRKPAGSSGWISSDHLKQDPLLAALGSNGGNTFTHALLPGSPAINAGNNDLALDPQTMFPLVFDQRAFARFTGTVDIGAYEAFYSTSPVTVGGRVLKANGRGISGARVTLSEPGGTVRYAVTNPFGHYRFIDLTPGTTYSVTATSKSYQFTSPQFVTADQNRSDLDFTSSL